MMDQKPVTEKILNLTLEIICLVTGKTFTAVKSGDHVTVLAPSHYFVIPEKTNRKRVLEVTSNIIELLRREDEADDLSMGEQEHLEVHKVFYKRAIMEEQLPPPSPDGSSGGNSPERSYFEDSTQEDQDISQRDQGDVFIKIKVEDLDGEELYDNEEQRKVEESPGMDTDDVEKTSSAPPGRQKIKGKPVTRICPGGDRNAQTKAAGPSHSRKSYTPTTSSHLGSPSAGRSSDAPNGGPSVDTAKEPSSEKPLSPLPSLPPGRSLNPPKEGVVLSAADNDDNKLYSCCKCGKTFMLQLLFGGRQRSEREPFTCCECQISSLGTSPTSAQQEDEEVGAKYYACTKCPKTFTRRTYLSHHQRVHGGITDYSCSECGKCFTNKSNLVVHARTHTGERPFPCFGCGKSFTHRSSLVRHLRAHRGQSH